MREAALRPLTARPRAKGGSKGGVRRAFTVRT
jgi:hypothetical protein